MEIKRISGKLADEPREIEIVVSLEFLPLSVFIAPLKFNAFHGQSSDRRRGSQQCAVFKFRLDIFAGKHHSQRNRGFNKKLHCGRGLAVSAEGIPCSGRDDQEI
jgi:hypothetical protein